jgi:hypothetical protein
MSRLSTEGGFTTAEPELKRPARSFAGPGASTLRVFRQTIVRYIEAFSSSDFAGLKNVNGLGELAGPLGAAA